MLKSGRKRAKREREKQLKKIYQEMIQKNSFVKGALVQITCKDTLVRNMRNVPDTLEKYTFIKETSSRNANHDYVDAKVSWSSHQHKYSMNKNSGMWGVSNDIDIAIILNPDDQIYTIFEVIEDGWERGIIVRLEGFSDGINVSKLKVRNHATKRSIFDE